ncbi:MAG: LytTR family DNA-binding domain-containing protein [Acidobacteriota bacterium]
MTPTIRTMIVDDEPLARQGLRVRLEREDDIEIVGEAEDGPSAVDAVLRLRPDLLLLDVQMPGFDGFEVVSRTAAEHLPNVVFVTAYDRYALQAFMAHALDYILKPIAHRRFQEALRRARRELERDADAESAERLRGLLDARDADEMARVRDLMAGAVAGPPPSFISRFTVRDGERLLLIRTRDIEWIEAAANYLLLHAGPRAFQVRMTMTDVERRLDPKQFARIHRSTIVNLDRVASIHPEYHGEYRVVLASGQALKVGRAFRDRLV